MLDFSLAGDFCVGPDDELQKGRNGDAVFARQRRFGEGRAHCSGMSYSWMM